MRLVVVRLDGLSALNGNPFPVQVLRRGALLPASVAQVEHLHVEAPAVLLSRRRTEQAPVDEFGLVLDGTQEGATLCVEGQRFLVAPRAAPVFRLTEPARPIAHGSAYLEEEPQFAIGHLEKYGVPAGLALQFVRNVLKAGGLGDVVVVLFVGYCFVCCD